MSFFLGAVIMENEMLVNLLWFLSGAVAYKFLSYIFGIGSAINLFNQTLVGSLLLVRRMNEQMLLSHKIHITSLQQQQTSEEEIENTKTIDIQSLELWRSMIITTIISCCPRKIRSGLKFDDWKSAMNLLK